MLRRVVEGLVLIFLVVLLMIRVDLGFMLPILAVGAIMAFTAWRIRGVWMRYQAALVAHRAPANLAIGNEMQALRGQQHARGAELTFWSGFVLGGALVHGAPHPGQAGDMSELGVGGEAGGFDGGGFDGGL